LEGQHYVCSTLVSILVTLPLHTSSARHVHTFSHHDSGYGFLFEYEDDRPRYTPTESELWRDMLRQLETRETCGVPEDFWNDIKDNRLQYTLAEAEEWSQMLRQMEKKQVLDMQEHFSSEVKIWTLKFHHDS
jgi:hypothetical protein